MIRLNKVKIEDSGYVVTFTCDHQSLLKVKPKPDSCGLKTVKDVEGYRCGQGLARRNPKLIRDDGCPGGYMMCDDCAGVVERFWIASDDAEAMRKEWTAD